MYHKMHFINTYRVHSLYARNISVKMNWYLANKKLNTQSKKKQWQTGSDKIKKTASVSSITQQQIKIIHKQTVKMSQNKRISPRWHTIEQWKYAGGGLERGRLWEELMIDGREQETCMEMGTTVIRNNASCFLCYSKFVTNRRYCSVMKLWC